MTSWLTEGRIAAALALLSEIGAAVWNAHLHQPVDLAALGGGLAAIVTASAALLAAPPAARAMLAKHRATLARLNARDEGDAL